MPELVDPNELISQAEAAELRGVSRASINELVKRGRLRSIEIGGKPYVYRSEVLMFEPDKGGRPPKIKASGTDGKVTVKSGRKGSKK